MARIGILTYFKVINYGAILQAYALYKMLHNKYGSDVEVINYTHKIFKDKISTEIFIKSRGVLNNFKHFVKYFILSKGKVKNEKFIKFVNDNLKLSKEVENVSSIANNYDILIIGSDQVWNPDYTNNQLDENFLLSDYSFDHIKKISFASSAGSFIFTGAIKEQLASSLLKFNRISVRETSLKSQFSDYPFEIKDVLDPTFLFNKSEWNKLFNLYDEELERENYLLLYTFDNDTSCYQVSNKLKNELGFKFYSITSKFVKHKSVDKQLDSLSPIEFLKYFYNAKFIVTNSFHGTCFSINFFKHFYSIRKGNNPARVEDLLKKFSLANRLIRSVDDVNLEHCSIDYHDRLESERNKSLNVLLDSIDS